MASLMQSVTGATGLYAHATVSISSRCCCRASTSCSSSASSAGSSGAPLIRPLISTPASSGNSFAAPSPIFASRPALRHCEALPEPAPGTPAVKQKSILCQQCDGNGAVLCSQCKGGGTNTEDHFNGRFKAGTICWLCRGKKHILCGECNGAGFLGGFMNAQDD